MYIVVLIMHIVIIAIMQIVIIVIAKVFIIAIIDLSLLSHSPTAVWPISDLFNTWIDHLINFCAVNT